MPNICFLGAGSGFTRPLAVDVMQVAAIGGGEFRLVDIDADRLDLSCRVVQKVAEKVGGGRWTIRASTDRRAALPGADYVINCIEVSGAATVRFDNDIPLKYGISQCIGDTLGPGGLMKALRTVPVWLDVLRGLRGAVPGRVGAELHEPDEHHVPRSAAHLEDARRRLVPLRSGLEPAARWVLWRALRGAGLELRRHQPPRVVHAAAARRGVTCILS